MKEEWRPIPSYPGYFVSNLGRVGSTHVGDFKVRPACKGRNGYLRLPLIKDGVWHTVMPHRLVLEAFVGPCPPGKECDHINGKRDDNRLENLRWVTRRENLMNPITRRRRILSRRRLQVMCVETGVVYESLKDAERRTGFHSKNIAKNCRGTQSYVHGFHFKFV